jgi:uncharacterized OB-fold protein/acyl dehydratase
VSERFEELARFPDHSAELEGLVGLGSGEAQLSPHAVNAPMIRHWVEAMGDTNPVYVSPRAAETYGYDQVIAPPTMLQAWIMRGLRATQLVEAARKAGDGNGSDPNDAVMKLLDAEGLTSVVATNCDQHYDRPLVIGDRLLVRSVIESISDPKRTGLGTGRFLTTRMDFTAVPDAEVPESPTSSEITALAERGDPVATMRFRILKFLPPTRPAGPEGDDAATKRPLRPRPATTQDNSFWFEGARAHKLLIQRCASCGTLRHPPLPACGKCRSLEWDTVEASGRGTLYSFVVVHYPQVASFDYPLPIGLVELEEGTRVVANIDGIAPGELQIGMPLRATFVDFDDDLSLPVFVPVFVPPPSASVGVG